MRYPAPIYSDPTAIRSARAQLQVEGKTVVMTNGVFDLLHVGHLRYLTEAASHADVLWVAVNSDASVRQLKGETRPLVTWAERVELLAALTPVGAVLFFDERTADTMLRLVEPEVYVKGGDYTPDTLPEAPTARAIGAKIVLLPFVEGRSTSLLIQKIMDSHRQ